MNGKYEEKSFQVASIIMDDKLNQIKQNVTEIESSVSYSSIKDSEVFNHSEEKVALGYWLILGSAWLR